MSGHKDKIPVEVVPSMAEVNIKRTVKNPPPSGYQPEVKGGRDK